MIFLYDCSMNCEKTKNYRKMIIILLEYTPREGGAPHAFWSLLVKAKISARGEGGGRPILDQLEF